MDTLLLFFDWFYPSDNPLQSVVHMFVLWVSIPQTPRWRQLCRRRRRRCRWWWWCQTLRLGRAGFENPKLRVKRPVKFALCLNETKEMLIRRVKLDAGPFVIGERFKFDGGVAAHVQEPELGFESVFGVCRSFGGCGVVERGNGIPSVCRSRVGIWRRVRMFGDHDGGHTGRHIFGCYRQGGIRGFGFWNTV